MLRTFPGEAVVNLVHITLHLINLWINFVHCVLQNIAYPNWQPSKLLCSHTPSAAYFTCTARISVVNLTGQHILLQIKTHLGEDQDTS